MRPATALPSVSICSFCYIRALSHSRLVLRTAAVRPARQPLFRPFITTPRLSAQPISPAEPPQSPYASGITSFPALSAAVTDNLLNASRPPTEDEVLAALAALRAHAKYRLSSGKSGSADSPASALLNLSSDSSSSPSPILTPTSTGNPSTRKLDGALPSAKKGDFDDLTDLSFTLLSDPKTFITPPILSSFVVLQRLLADPTPIPAVFALYATKPILPASGHGAPKQPKPKQAKYAIPHEIATEALEAAIDTGDMTSALDIIDTSVSAPAFRRSKFIRRALPFITTGAVSPVAIYAVADKLASWQEMVDYSLALKYAFAGLLAYSGFAVSMGLVALGTTNDQMVRVTWVPGTPLRERWVREEERAALDTVAMAWGFEEAHKRGFEEGEEWELLREVCGRKGMILDNPTLMEGME